MMYNTIESSRQALSSPRLPLASKRNDLRFRETDSEAYARSKQGAYARSKQGAYARSK
jgi:hypothetical protein